MEVSVRWNATRTFLLRDMKIADPAAPSGGDAGDGLPAMHITQRIGWDPLVDRIRSWSFSSDGSRGEATWFRDGGSWVVRSTAVLPDGTQTSSINIYTFDGQDRCTWRVVRPALSADDDPPARATWVRTPGSTTP